MVFALSFGDGEVRVKPEKNVTLVGQTKLVLGVDVEPLNDPLVWIQIIQRPSDFGRGFV